jgi:hypothetical protein
MLLKKGVSSKYQQARRIKTSRRMSEPALVARTPSLGLCQEWPARLYEIDQSAFLFGNPSLGSRPRKSSYLNQTL